MHYLTCVDVQPRQPLQKRIVVRVVGATNGQLIQMVPIKRQQRLFCQRPPHRTRQLFDEIGVVQHALVPHRISDPRRRKPRSV